MRRLLLALLTLGMLTTVSVASSSAGSGLNVSGTWKSVYHCETGWCAGQDFPAGPFQLAQAAGSSIVTTAGATGTLSGHTLKLHGGSSGYTFTETLTISADGRSWKGPLNDSNGTTGIDIGTRIDTPTVSLAVSIQAPVGARGADIGQVYDVTVGVTAKGGDFTDVRLSQGIKVAGAPYVRRKRHYVSCGNSVQVTYAPPEASGFPLAEGQTRSFVFRVRAHRPGPSRLEVHAIGVNASGTTDQAAATVVRTDNPPVRRGGQEIEPMSGNFSCSAQHP